MGDSIGYRACKICGHLVRNDPVILSRHIDTHQAKGSNNGVVERRAEDPEQADGQPA